MDRYYRVTTVSNKQYVTIKSAEDINFNMLHSWNDKPAIFEYESDFEGYSQCEWYINGKIHRAVGPAIDCKRANSENHVRRFIYYLNGLSMTKLEWLNNPLVTIEKLKMLK